MTQLFDITRYDHNDEPGRRLRSIELDTTTAMPSRSHSWRLDDQTVAIGRKGIELARKALREASPGDSEPCHSASDHKDFDHKDSDHKDSDRKAA